MMRTCVAVAFFFFFPASRMTFLARADIESSSNLISRLPKPTHCRQTVRKCSIRCCSFQSRSPSAFTAPCLGVDSSSPLGPVTLPRRDDTPRHRSALPEVQLVHPSRGGGCQRLPRLIGLAVPRSHLLAQDRTRPKAFRLGHRGRALVPPAILADVHTCRRRGAWRTALRPKISVPAIRGILLYGNPLAGDRVPDGAPAGAPSARAATITAPASRALRSRRVLHAARPRGRGLKRKRSCSATKRPRNVSRQARADLSFATNQLKKDPARTRRRPSRAAPRHQGGSATRFMGSGIAGTATGPGGGRMWR